jgi:hypothetical protein
MRNGHFDLPSVHPVINEGVDHGVGHRKPVEGQVQVLHILCVGHGAVVVCVNKVGVVGKPADREN